MSNSLDPDQNRISVGPDLGPNCLQRFSADDKFRDKVSEILGVNTVLLKLNISYNNHSESHL